MKKIIYLFLLVSVLCFYGCEDFLKEEPKSTTTKSFLYSTEEGIIRASMALYSIDRGMISESESTVYSVLMDRGTDIDVFRGGSGSTFFRYDNFLPTNGDVAFYWRHQYRIIGKSNEIIEYAKKLEQTEKLKASIGEAYLFRARAHFNLWVRFDRINLNTKVVTADNVNDIMFSPANKEDVFNLMYADLDSAMVLLPAKKPVDYKGRFTQWVARHVKAKVAMYRNDYDEAIKMVDEIDASGIYSLMPTPKDVFEGADLIHNETLFAHQFSRQRGGAAAHRMSLIYTPNYSKITGLKKDISLGGYAWGRAYPNAYLISLYDNSKDKRHKEWFKYPQEWIYIFPEILPPGKTLGQEVTISNANFLECKHTSTLKYFDRWTQLNPDETGSFKDLIVYRLAETYLLGAEAYMRKSGGSHAKALYYYNKTWERAGNDKFSGTLTEDMILDEHARELHLEGHRFEILKRTGKFLDKVRLYGGEIKADAISGDYTHPRKNLKDHFISWPIPQTEIDQMGGQTVFPQNDGYMQ